MRKIEQDMCVAIEDFRNWRKANTEVQQGPEGMDVYLHGNHIGSIDATGLVVNERTLERWPTRTTKSRLRALEREFGMSPASPLQEI